VVGEIFMRDNPYCSGFLIERLEALGAETVIAPTREWISYSTYRYWRDSVWKREPMGLLKSKIQQFFQDNATHTLERAVAELTDERTDVTLTEMLSYCNPYVHKHYDGDPPIALGAAAKLAESGASGVANLLPFTCMPGTLIAAVSPSFRKDYGNIPWVNVAYDGQDDTGIETRLQAFVHQAREYAEAHGLDTPLEERFPAAEIAVP
jgi:predicted nucleotide-binding protein (sugar kinase/HSP70/actin superfamily)